MFVCVCALWQQKVAIASRIQTCINSIATTPTKKHANELHTLGEGRQPDRPTVLFLILWKPVCLVLRRVEDREEKLSPDLEAI